MHETRAFAFASLSALLRFEVTSDACGHWGVVLGQALVPMARGGQGLSHYLQGAGGNPAGLCSVG